MAQWENDWGDEFETEEDARENVIEKMEWSDYEEELQYIISFHDLFVWAHNQVGFYEYFENELNEAENNFFKANYHEVNEEEE